MVLLPSPWPGQEDGVTEKKKKKNPTNSFQFSTNGAGGVSKGLKKFGSSAS